MRAAWIVAAAVACGCGVGAANPFANPDMAVVADLAAASGDAATTGGHRDLAGATDDAGDDGGACRVQGGSCLVTSDCCDPLVCDDSGACAMRTTSSCAGPGASCSHSGACCDGLWCDGAACTANPSGCVPAGGGCSAGGTPCCDVPAASCDANGGGCCINPNNSPSTVRCRMSSDCCHGNCDSSGVCVF